MEQPPQIVTPFGDDGIEQLQATVIAMIEAADEEDPVRRVAIVLVWHGRQESPFKVAWASAMRSLPRDAETAGWRAIFKSQREQWRESYEARFSARAAA